MFIVFKENEIDLELTFLIDIIDNIHIYFIHSFDTGFRVKRDKINDSENENENEINNNFIDSELKNLSLYLKEKKKKLILNKNNKFMTNTINNKNDKNKEFYTDLLNKDLSKNIDNESLRKWKLFIFQNEFDSDSIKFDKNNNNKNDEIDESDKESNIYKDFKNIYHFLKTYNPKKDKNKNKINDNITFGFGHRFFYWDYFKNKNDYKQWNGNNYDNILPTEKQPKYLYVSAAYSTLKNEILSKNVSINKFNEIYFNAKILLNKSDTLKAIKSTYYTNYDNTYYSDSYYYDLVLFSPLLIPHICSLLFYTNFTELSYNFSSSFRAISFNESVKEIGDRNSKWANMSKYLRELIECYGEQIKNAKDPIFFHGISKMLFNNFVTNFYSPTSTTKQLEVAMLFCKDNGIILELKKYDTGIDKHLRYFNVSFVSAFSNEDERLFIGGQYKLEFKTIRLIKENLNLKLFIHSLANLNKIINGESMINEKITKKDFKIIGVLLSFSNNKYNDFINKCFKAFCNEKEIIKLNIKWLYYSKYYPHFSVSPSIPNLLSFSLIANIFKNAETIYCEETDWDNEEEDWSSSFINSSYILGLISDIDKINKNKQTKLNKIYIKTYKHKISDNLDLSSFSSSNWKIERGKDKDGWGDEFCKSLILTK